MSAQKRTDDSAVDAKIRKENRSFAGPHTRQAKHTLGADEKHDQLAGKEVAAESRQEALLDEALEESFPSSDPVSVKRIT